MTIRIDTSSLAFLVPLFIFGALLGATGAHSWTAPTGAPPNSNASGPANVSGLSQIKTGSLSVNGFSNSGSEYVVGNLGVGVASPAQKLHINGYARATGLCINTSCITSWPDNSGGYGASTWARAGSLICPTGSVVTGIEARNSGYSNVGGIIIRCTVLTP